MPKVYIAAAFRRFSDRSDSEKAYGRLTNTSHADLLERIEDKFLDYGYDTCLPHRDEGMWGEVYYNPPAISSLCLRHVATSDVICAIAEGGRGVHVELGYASALANKVLLMLYRKGTEPSTLIWGLPGYPSRWALMGQELASSFVLEYEDEAELLSHVKSFLEANHGAAPSAAPTARIFQIFDLGSHTVKCKVIKHRPGSAPRVLYQAKQSIGLMGDVLEAGAFSEEKIDQLLQILDTWTADSAQYGPDKTVALGTAAFREAKNAQLLSNAVFQRIGTELAILTPEREMQLVYSGVAASFKKPNDLAVLNLGGGSTQVGFKTSGDLQSLLLDFGTRQLSKGYPWDAPMSAKTFGDLLLDVERRIRRQLGDRAAEQVSRLVHTGGELDFLLKCEVPLTTSWDSPVHTSEIAVSDFRAFAFEFCSLDPRLACNELGLNPAWASGSVASNAIALAVAGVLGAQKIIPSNFNISDGVVREFA